jgi:hypothetical protein
LGSSFTCFRERGFWSQDATLEVWLILLAQQAAKRQQQTWLVEAAENWHRQGTLGFIGCVSAGLDEIATSDDRIAIVIELSHRALAYLLDQGDTLSLAFLNSFEAGGSGALFTRDLPTEMFTRIG